ncbi:hypothetical protein SAMN06295974_3854 [Plantibacter flavus]|uniref:Uncharacterized protein n=1 Tax=Plantibacter flavus TaxID=150123 RepID=A0A3N2BL55_9MICO|nr:hypothetical protein [Plantibacter flavus]ROR76000.1 hypothetical protein EDD42_3952 [Plantibacter flavus]SMG49494.1 hypothetical protein SAMN06295974_3854 [Plantibacter flavus]
MTSSPRHVSDRLRDIVSDHGSGGLSADEIATIKSSAEALVTLAGDRDRAQRTVTDALEAMPVHGKLFPRRGAFFAAADVDKVRAILIAHDSASEPLDTMVADDGPTCVQCGHPWSEHRNVVGCLHTACACSTDADESTYAWLAGEFNASPRPLKGSAS